MTHSPHSSLVKTCGSDMQNTYKYQLYYMQSYCTVHTILIANFLKRTNNVFRLNCFYTIAVLEFNSLKVNIGALQKALPH